MARLDDPENPPLDATNVHVAPPMHASRQGDRGAHPPRSTLVRERLTEIIGSFRRMLHFSFHHFRRFLATQRLTYKTLHCVVDRLEYLVRQ